MDRRSDERAQGSTPPIRWTAPAAPNADALPQFHLRACNVTKLQQAQMHRLTSISFFARS
eukprot:94502-Chlamydomonas_euryale.AAC.2